MRAQDCACSREPLVDEASDLVVDDFANMLRVVALLGDFAPEEDHLLLTTERDRPEPLAHPELLDHPAHDCRRTGDVIATTRAQLAEHDGFGGVSAERSRHRVD